MKKSFPLALFYCFLLISPILSAQKEAAHWYFGNRMGFDFTNCNPTFDLNGNMRAWMAPATISAPDGRLLFYANSLTHSVSSITCEGGIYNRNHQLMPNGAFTQFGEPDFQGSLILPAVGNSNKYFLFHQVPGGPNSFRALRYSTVDMSLNDGLGGLLDKQILMTDSLLRGMTATINAQKTGYWLAIRRFKGFIGSDMVCTIDIYLVQASGTTLVSSFPEIDDNVINTMKFSPNGQYLQYSKRLYNFDNSQGTLSAVQSLGTTTLDNAEFSANSKILYAYHYGSSAFALLQFDLTATNISGSALLLEPIGNASIKGGIQLAPDGKIYIGHINMSVMSVIENPSRLGTACNFRLYSLAIPRGDWYDLPNFPTNFLKSTYANANCTTTSVVDTDEALNLVVSPNPTSGRIKIQRFGQKLSVGTYSITNILGQIVEKGSLSESEQEVDLSHLSDGSYFISVRMSNQIVVKKIIKN
jgi:large repetitive protein